MDRVDFGALHRRLTQNGAQEKLTKLWVDRCLHHLGERPHWPQSSWSEAMCELTLRRLWMRRAPRPLPARSAAAVQIPGFSRRTGNFFDVPRTSADWSQKL